MDRVERPKSKISNNAIYQLEKKQKGKCNLCGTILIKKETHIDHIAALSYGGDNCYDNFQLLCIKCHQKKTNLEGYNYKFKIPEEKIICDKCGKIIEGYNKNHVEYLLAQHKLSKFCSSFESIV